tara:strand:+ start:79405 stop:81207 length:1803 start_codon:yes stop_codon:yes gene_type:complete
MIKLEKIDLLSISIAVLFIAAGALFSLDEEQEHFQKSQPVAEVSQKKGEVKLGHSRTLVWTEAAEGSLLEEGDKVYTKTNSSVELQFSDFNINVAPNSLVLVEQSNNQELELNLVKGRIQVSNTKKKTKSNKSKRRKVKKVSKKLNVAGTSVELSNKNESVITVENIEKKVFFSQDKGESTVGNSIKLTRNESLKKDLEKKAQAILERLKAEELKRQKEIAKKEQLRKLEEERRRKEMERLAALELERQKELERLAEIERKKEEERLRKEELERQKRLALIERKKRLEREREKRRLELERKKEEERLRKEELERQERLALIEREKREERERERRRLELERKKKLAAQKERERKERLRKEQEKARIEQERLKELEEKRLALAQAIKKKKERVERIAKRRERLVPGTLKFNNIFMNYGLRSNELDESGGDFNFTGAALELGAQSICTKCYKGLDYSLEASLEIFEVISTDTSGDNKTQRPVDLNSSVSVKLKGGLRAILGLKYSSILNIENDDLKAASRGSLPLGIGYFKNTEDWFGSISYTGDYLVGIKSSNLNLDVEYRLSCVFIERECGLYGQFRSYSFSDGDLKYSGNRSSVGARLFW